ncbi:MAG: hypothetical protein RL354_1236, partial [Planctomycetota bacterium]
MATTSFAAEGRDAEGLAEHDVIVAAITARDGDAAEAALRTHISRAYETRLRVDAGELRSIAGPHFHEGLGGRLDRNDTTIFVQLTIAMAQQTAIGQIDANLFAADQFGSKARALPLLKTQFKDVVDRGMAVGTLGSHLEGHDRGSEGQNPVSEQKIALSHGQHARGFAGQQFAIGLDRIGFRIDLHPWREAVQDHVGLAQGANSLDGHHRLAQRE